MARKIESKRALAIVLIGIIALIILPILDRIDIGWFNALTLTTLSIGVFLFDSRKGNLNNSFLSSLIFIASALTLNNIYSSIFASLPLLNQIFGVLIVMALFFLTPPIVRYVLQLFKNNPTLLLITGRIIAVVTALITSLFIYLKLGYTLNIFNYSIAISDGFTFWSAFVVLWIIIQLYQMWRNVRDITANHRFLYNAVALYILSLIIYIGYIRDFITFTNL